jgi:hypothetical protein
MGELGKYRLRGVGVTVPVTGAGGKFCFVIVLLTLLTLLA